jgi:hypothetical protein
LAKKMRTHEDGSLVVHTTEAEFDQPKVGDVRIEEGIARDPQTGEVLSALYRLSNGEVVRPRAMGASFTLPPDAQPVRDDQRSHKLYKFTERPPSGRYGLYAHEDNTVLEGAPKDREGFYLDASGNRMPRYVKPLYDREGNLQYTDATRQRIKCEPDPHYWALAGEHDSQDKALKAAEKHL